jgi:hypothetical protein
LKDARYPAHQAALLADGVAFGTGTSHRRPAGASSPQSVNRGVGFLRHESASLTGLAVTSLGILLMVACSSKVPDTAPPDAAKIAPVDGGTQLADSSAHHAADAAKLPTDAGAPDKSQDAAGAGDAGPDLFMEAGDLRYRRFQ